MGIKTPKITASHVTAMAAVAVVIISGITLYFAYYKRATELDYSLGNAKLKSDFVDRELIASFVLSNSGNTDATVTRVFSSVQIQTNMDLRYRINGKHLYKKLQNIGLPKWQNLLKSPLSIPPGESKSINATICLPSVFKVVEQINIKLLLTIEDHNGNLFQGSVPVGIVNWSDLTSGPKHIIIGYNEVFVANKNTPMNLFRSFKRSNSIISHGGPLDEPSCLNKSER